jgi:hypothetical protein
MSRKIRLSAFSQNFVFAITFMFFAEFAAAQFERALPPIADPRDTRFAGVQEDWTSPELDLSSLKPIQPLVFDAGDYPGYSVELIQVQWRWGDPIDLYVMKPKGIKKPAVILYLYSYPSETDTFKDEAWQRAVTKDSFAAVGFLTALTGHRYHDRPMKEWFISELQECLADSAHDVQMVLNYLAKRGDLDTDHVGMIAEGSGASVGILASAVDPRIKALDVLDPWGDWPTWMAKSPFVPEEERANYIKPDYLKKVGALDPVDWLPKIQAKEFRLQDATFDSETPASIHSKLRAAAPVGTTVVTYNTVDDYKAAINDNKQMEWIYNKLRSLIDRSAATGLAEKGSSSGPRLDAVSNP